MREERREGGRGSEPVRRWDRHSPASAGAGSGCNLQPVRLRWARNLTATEIFDFGCPGTAESCKPFIALWGKFGY